MRARRAVLPLILALAALAGAASPQDAVQSPVRVQGRVYPAARLRAVALQGVTLGMPLQKATKILTTRGFESRLSRTFGEVAMGREADGGETFYRGVWESVALEYRNLPSGQSQVVSVLYSLPIARDDSRTPQQWRAEMVAQYGAPSDWLQFLFNGRASDIMDYVSVPALLEEKARLDADGCAGKWFCQDPNARVDCRVALQKAAGPTFQIAFNDYTVLFQLRDYPPMYESLMRSADFRAQDGDKFCPIMPLGPMPRE
jgi:hypothetical protein